MGWDAFISYSSKDKHAAETTCATLEAAGLRCWIAPRDISPGVEYATAIVDGIDNSRVLVVIFSSSANASPDVRREVQLAESRSIRIVPLRIENVTPTEAMAYFLSAVQWVDAVTPPLEAHLQSLAASIKVQLPPANRAEPPPPSERPMPRPQEVPPAQPPIKDRSQGNARRIGPLVAIVVVLLLAAGGLYWSGLFDQPKPPDIAATPAASSAPETSATPSRDTWTAAQLNGTNFDVFSCEAGNKASNDAIAAKIKDRLEQNRTSGRVRIRAWSASANQQAGYNVKGYQIRYESANGERDLATLIKPVVDKLVGPDAFVLYQVQNKTPSYLSLFVCPS
jgi:TIR domain-containing protein